jgi:hypothetical protein
VRREPITRRKVTALPHAVDTTSRIERQGSDGGDASPELQMYLRVLPNGGRAVSCASVETTVAFATVFRVGRHPAR